MSKTKIICTLGPASNNKQTFTSLVQNGLNVVRLNLSHKSDDNFESSLKMIREVSQELEIPIPILLDTRGPEIRTKKFVDDSVELITGASVCITYGNDLGTDTDFCINYPFLHEDVSVGSVILIDDGLIELEVKEIIDKKVICVVKNGGLIKNHKGVNIPNINLKLPILSAADEQDILRGIEQDIDFIAVSFVRRREDVEYVRKLLESNGGSEIQIISKIESQEGVDNIDEIIDVSDGIMVARGDLGVETPAELIPLTQKMIISKCNAAEIPVITATQMLDSMIHNPRPTRAEVSDVANAVLDGTDVIMLSGETAAGKFPVEAVSVMRKIAKASEQTANFKNLVARILTTKQTSVTNAVSYAACSTALHLDAKAIICPTFSGKTAKLIGMFRPNIPILATTANHKAQRQMMMYWGVIPLLMKQETSSDVLFYKSVEKAKAMGLVKPKDLVIITAGVPLGVAGNTNLMKIQEVE